MRIGVLGTTAATDSTDVVNLGGLKQRALLAALALHRGRAVSADTLADLIWNGTPPPGVSGTLQGYVAGLRRALEPDRTTRGGGTLLVTEAPGYALRLPDDDLDTAAFETTVSGAHTQVVPLADALCRGRALPPGSPDAGGLAALHKSIDEALALWRGVPFADLGEAPAAEAERARLEELRVLAVEDRATLGILLGLHATVAAELDALTRQHPLRERAWSLRALALARSGRQADALAVLRQVRDVLDEELGLEPGPELRAVQAAVLRQEATATAEPAPSPAPAARAVPDPDEQSPLPFPTLWGWSLAGRDDELTALTELVDRVVQGTEGAPAFVALTADPGIGKSRLAIEAATYAADQGMTIAWGRCSQDDGAPALWPWATVLERLGSELPSSVSGDDSGSGVPRLGDRGAAGAGRRGRAAAAAGHRRPALGRHLQPAGAAAAHRGRRQRRAGCPAARDGHLARAPATGGCARRGGRGAGAQARAAAPAAWDLGGRDRAGVPPGLRDRADRRRDRGAAPAYRGQPVLPGRVRPAGPRAR